MKQFDYDLVVIGAGEITAVRLANRLLEGGSWESLPGIAFLQGGTVHIHAGAPEPGSREFSEINYTLLDLTRYIKKDATGARCLDYLSSRGCPHPCTYCAISKLWLFLKK